MLLKVKSTCILPVISYIFFMKPAGLASFDAVDAFFDYGKIAVLMFLLFRYVERNKFSRLTLLIAIQQFILLCTTAINGGDLFSFFKSAGTIIGAGVLIDYVLSREDFESLKLFSYYSFCLIIINLLSIICFPDGIGVNFNGTTEYFLGIDNRFLYTYLPSICLIGIVSLIKTNKFNSMFVLSYIISFGTLLWFWSVGAFLCYSLLLVYIVYAYRNPESSIFNIKSYLFIILFLFIFVVLTRSYIVFSDFIENTLQKDITLSSRVFLWNTAIDIFSDNMLFGIGIHDDGYLKKIFYPVTHPHNHILYILYSSGVIGLSLLVTQIILVAIKLNKYRINNIAGFISIILFSTFVALTADSFDYSPGLTMILFLGYNCDILQKLQFRSKMKDARIDYST